MSEPILAMPEPDWPIIVHTDFSHCALSTILEQRKSDNKCHIISCASRNCSAAEAKLGPTDGKILALVFAVTKFHTYLAGTQFVVVTDHAALVHLENAKTRNPKLPAGHSCSPTTIIKYSTGQAGFTTTPMA